MNSISRSGVLIVIGFLRPEEVKMKNKEGTELELANFNDF
jgi:hypothetical protein